MGTTPQRQQGPRAHPSAMKRMSMPVMPVSRPVPGPGTAGAPQGRPVRPGLGHGRMPSMQAPGAPRVLSGPARPPFRTLSGAQHARSPTMVRSPVMPSSPTGAIAAPRRVHDPCLARMSLGPKPCARSAMAPGHPRKIPWWKQPRAPRRQRRPLRRRPRRRLLRPHPNRHPCPVLGPTLPRDAARTLQLISPRTASATLATRSRPRRPRIKRIACSRLLPWATRRLAVYPRPCMLLLRMRRP